MKGTVCVVVGVDFGEGIATTALIALARAKATAIGLDVTEFVVVDEYERTMRRAADAMSSFGRFMEKRQLEDLKLAALEDDWNAWQRLRPAPTRPPTVCQLYVNQHTPARARSSPPPKFSFYQGDF